MFSKEQLEQELKKTNDELNRLAQADKPLTKEEQSWRGKLRFRKVVLDEIKPVSYTHLTLPTKRIV